MDNFQTPQKVLKCPASSVQQIYKTSPAAFKLVNNHIRAQFSNLQKVNGKISRPSLLSQTPDKKYNEFISTPGSGRKSNLSAKTKSFHLFPVVNTSPSENTICRKVINPFEAHLTDRLHLPLICSPSLFHRPSTPQCSSTNFEWTIEEVSSIGPANVEPHETQFQDSLDPEMEAKTQAAISSFFKEQQIVPSPIDCPLRKKRIFLAAAEAALGNSPHLIRPVKRIKDGIAQTTLSLPPVLPKEIEDALKPYFCFLENQQQSPTINCDKSDSLIAYHEARDASLRRKLFAVPNVANNDTLTTDSDDIYNIDDNCAFGSPPPASPDLVEEIVNTSNIELLNDNGFDKSSFGSLSPISKLQSDSPNPKRFSSEKRFIDNIESISPIKSASSPNITTQQSKINSTSLHQRKLKEGDNSFTNSLIDSKLYRSTPENSILSKNSSNESQLEIKNMSVDSSFNIKIGRLLVNSCITKNDSKQSGLLKSKSMTEVDFFNQNENFEDDMQISQLSERSMNSSLSLNADTPRRAKKTASRKNLSTSFSSHFSDDENDINCPNSSKDFYKFVDNVKERCTSVKQQINDINENVNSTTKMGPSKKSGFYRTDSGFNEMTNTQDDGKFVEMSNNLPNLVNKVYDTNITLGNEDISMISCSTPSKKLF